MSIKENHIYFFLIFWVYGIYGIGTDVNSDFQYFHIFSPILLTPLVFIFNKDNQTIFKVKKILNNFNQKDNLIYFFLIILILLFLSWEKINLSITDDENAYVGLAIIHSSIIIPKFLLHLSFVQNYEVKTIIRLISFLLVFFGFLYLLIVNHINVNKKIKIIIFFLSILILRLVIGYFGGNPFSHPPMIGLPGLISISLFGLSDFILKMSHFLIYIIFAFYIFLKLKFKYHKILSTIITLALFSMPGILYLGISYEQALWSMICFSLVIIQIQKEQVNYKKIFLIILFFSCFRILSLAAIALPCLNILYKSKSINQFITETKILIKNSYPLFIILPFLIFSFFEKSGITVDRLGVQFTELEFLLFDLNKMVLDSFHYIPSFIIYLFFLISFFNFKKNLLVLSFIFILITIYSGVITSNSKYLYEILFPFLIYTIVFNNFDFKILNLKKIVMCILFIMFSSNVILLKNFKNFCIELKNPMLEKHFYQAKFGCWFVDNDPFDLEKAYIFLYEQADFSFNKLYVPGVYYGLMPSLINGIKMKDFKIHKEINQYQNKLNLENNVSWISADARLINKDTRIKYVLIADMSNSVKLEIDLINLGWKKIFNNIEKSFLTRTTVLTRIK
jgi:hypothetical protein